MFHVVLDKARALRATASKRASSGAGRLRANISGHHKAWVEGALAGVLTVAALSLSGSAGSMQLSFDDPVKRAASTLGGDFSAGGLSKISYGMSPYALTAAARLGLGQQGWTPTGMPGWGVYDLSTPTLITENLDFDQARAFNALIEPTATPVRPMKPFVIKAAAADKERALQCLTQAVYYEAGFESGEGQQAVAQVVLNRVRHPGYPNSVCGVVYQGSQRATGCQFSFTCDGSLSRAPGAAAWLRARSVAAAALNGFVYKGVGTSTHYHADYVFPYWAVTLVKLKQIGAHIFYRMTGPSGAPAGFSSSYAGNEAALSAAVLTGGDARTPDAPSAVLEAVAPAAKTVTLTVGGETRTYTVAAGTPAAATEATGTNATATPMPSLGGLTPSRRHPTAEEIRQINERLKTFEEKQTPPKPAVAPKGTE